MMCITVCFSAGNGKQLLAEFMLFASVLVSD